MHIEDEAGGQQNLETNDIRNLARAQVRYERNSFSVTLGLTHAEDKFDDGENRTSDLGELGLAKRLMDRKLRLRASVSTSRSGETENSD